MSLTLEIEFLSGVCFAAIGPDSDRPDWPPQPDRIYSALVASWDARGQREEERAALEWLEGLPEPKIQAAVGEPRTSGKVYVPPNDYKTPKNELNKLKWYRDYLSKGIRPPKDSKLGNPRKDWIRAVSVAPGWRERKERLFPATRPHESILRLFWPEASPDAATLASLQSLARDTSYVGHSASLTRCRFHMDDNGVDAGKHTVSKRRIYKGRLAQLEESFKAGRRPSEGDPVARAQDAVSISANVFAQRWLILEHIDGVMPDIRASALVSKAIRDTLLSGYAQSGLGDKIPQAVSGHDTEKKPTREPHLAIVPLPFAGFPYADGHVMGFALIPPYHGDRSILDDEAFRKAFRMVARFEGERRVMAVSTKEGTAADRAFCIKLAPTIEPSKASLDPKLYVKPARTFATVTPIALDRHLKEKGEARDREIAVQIAVACRNIGLPEPEGIAVGKHSALEGAPSAYPSGNAPRWMRWRLPASLASRQLTHAIFRFPEPIDGPVLLGAGRFAGLGLCRPLDEERE